MAWLSIRLSLPAARIETLSDLLMELGAESVTVRDAGDAPVLEPAPGETPLWPHAELDALFPLDADVATVRARLVRRTGDRDDGVLDVRFVEDADWSHTWRNHADRASFRRPVVGAAARRSVAGRTGGGVADRSGARVRHRWPCDHRDVSRMARAADARRLVGGGLRCRFGDSRYRGVAARGARHVVAVDHDPQACLATRANATYNGIASERITIIAPDGLASDDSRPRAREHSGWTIDVARTGSDAAWSNQAARW